MHIYDMLHKISPDHHTVVDRLPKFVISNVADYYYFHEKEFWRIEDFPYPHPPFDELWFEYKKPKSFLKRLIPSMEDPAYAAQIIDNLDINFCGICTKNADTSKSYDHDWTIRGFMLYTHAHGPFKGHPVKLEPYIDLNFSIVDGVAKNSIMLYNRTHGNPEDLVNAFHPVLMAFSFASCRNIEIIRVEAPSALNKSRIKKGKLPITPHHLIKILPFGKVFTRSTRTLTIGDDGKLDITIRRGSFARYGPTHNKGLLFGKYEGIFWRPAINLKPEAPPEYIITGVKK